MHFGFPRRRTRNAVQTQEIIARGEDMLMGENLKKNHQQPTSREFFGRHRFTPPRQEKPRFQCRPILAACVRDRLAATEPR
jgi:hypothetical protein